MSLGYNSREEERGEREGGRGSEARTKVAPRGHRLVFQTSAKVFIDSGRCQVAMTSMPTEGSNVLV